MRRRKLFAALFCATLLLGLAVPNIARPSEVQSVSPVALPVTNGLVHWWPNLFDTRDEISGEEGAVMGVLPPVSADVPDDTEFNHLSGWVQLRPALTNQTFTVAFWMRWRLEHHTEGPVVLAQEDADTQWRFHHQWNEGALFHVSVQRGRDTEQGKQFAVSPEVWHHLALAFDGAAGRLVCWVDASRVVDAPLASGPPTSSAWLTVGNRLKGDSQWGGAMRDLCVFDRVLNDAEIRALHDAGLPERPSRRTEARRRAAGRAVMLNWQTNVVAGTEGEFLHRRYTTEDGLPDNIVQAVLQARNGHLWVGTESGLARFDGRNFHTFTAENTPALAAIGSDISSLAADSDGTLWAGIYGGLLRIRGAWAFSPTISGAPEPSRSARTSPSVGPGEARQNEQHGFVSGIEFTAFTNGLPERFVLRAEPAGDGSVWVAGYRLQSPRGACRLRRLYPESGASSGETIVLGQVGRLVAATNGVWIATDQPAALLFWDGQAPSPLMVAKLDERPAGMWVRDGAAENTKSQVRGWMDPEATQASWVEINCSETGPVFGWHWKPGSFHATATRWSGERDRDDWLAGEGGLTRLRHKRIERVEFRNRPSPLVVTCACANREGGVWFGTEEDGLHFVHERLVRVFTTRDGLADDAIRSVCVLPDSTVVAGSDGGVNEWRGDHWSKNGQFGHVSAVTADRDGRIWLATDAIGPDALKCYSCGSRRPLQLPGLIWSDPNSLQFAADGTLWVVCALGVTWLKPQATTPETFLGNGWTNRVQFGRFRVGKELPDSPPLGLVEDHDGSIWTGTMGSGVLRVKDGRVTVFTRHDGLPGDFCAPVYCDGSDALWILTEAGLARRKDDRFQAVSAANGLPNDVFSDLVEDDFGHFWLPGKRGIHMLERRELEAFFDGRLDRLRSVTLGIRDGLLTPECASQHYPCAAKSADGRIWVPTREGLAVFDPRRVALDTQPLPLFIEDVLVNQQAIENAIRDRLPTGEMASLAASTSLMLKPGSGERMEIHYSAVSLNDADRVRFRYRLDGYDRDWLPETDLRLAFYTNLRPGQYRFRVKAANSHGIWNEDEATLDFSIAPHLWERPAFWAVVVLLIVGMAGVLHRHRMGVLRRLEELKRRQALASERERIAADMHDELGSALTHITMLGERTKLQLHEASPARHSLDRITGAAREVSSNISDLVWATNPRNNSLEELVVYVREHAAQLLETAGLEARLDFVREPPDRHVSATFRRNALSVVKEALNNIIKHAGAKEVLIRMAMDNNDLVLCVADDGCGFDVSVRTSAGNGLRNMERRVRELAGTMNVQSSPGRGTRLEFRLPLSSPGARLTGSAE